MRTRCDVEWTVDVLIEIGMAKAGSFDPQQHFTRAGMRIGKVLITQIFRSVIDECFHGLTPGISLPSTAGAVPCILLSQKTGEKRWPQTSQTKARRAKSIVTRLPAVKTLWERRASVTEGPRPTIA